MIVTNYLILAVLISSISIISTDYVNGEFNETFRNSLTFDVYFDVLDSSGLVFYSFDTSGNKFLMKSREMTDGKTRQFLCNFNGSQFNITTRRMLDVDNAVSWYRMVLVFENNNVYYRDDLKDNFSLVLSNLSSVATKHYDSFLGLPIAGNVPGKEKKMLFWMGNIGPYFGYKKKDDNQNQIIGCITWLEVNDKPVTFLTAGDHFSHPCTKERNQQFCYQGKCHNESIEHHILDCSMSSLNARKYCFPELSNYTEQIRTYEVRKSNLKSSVIKLAWRELQLRSNCLMEIVGKNGSMMLFYTNDNQEVVMYHLMDASMNCTTKIWNKILVNKIYILLVRWTDTNVTMKISDGEDISSIITDFITYPSFINIGLSSQSMMCNRFQGDMAFKYNTSQFKELRSSIKITIPKNTTTKSTNGMQKQTISVLPFHKIYLWQLILSGTIITFSLIAAIIIYITAKIKIRLMRAARPQTNIYEEETESGDFYPLPKVKIKQIENCIYDLDPN